MRLLLVGALSLGLAVAYPMEKRKMALERTGHKEEFGGFGGGYENLPYDARIPAMIGAGRGAVKAESRQGSGGGGFAAPSFSIPFQPNFNFNEFDSPFGRGSGSGSFSQFLSGLGGQGELGAASPFVAQTEQRFNRPQAFKRETESYPAQNKEYQQSSSRYNNARSRPIERVSPVYRNPQPYSPPRVAPAQYSVPAEPEYRARQEPERRRVQPVYRAPTPESRSSGGVEGFSKPDFPGMDFSMDFEPAKFQAQAKHMEEEQSRVEQENRRQEQVEMRQEQENRRREQEEKTRYQQEQRERFEEQEQERARFQEKKEELRRAQAQKQEMYKEQEMQQEQERYRQQQQKQERFQDKEFKPPSLIEKFQQPVVKSTEPFTNFDMSYTPMSSPAPPPASHPTFASFKPAEPSQQKTGVTKKPVFQYEKKNFREPVKAQAREQGPHPLIRIKPKQQSASPRPQSKQIRPQAGGFKPFRPKPQPVVNPQPGRMEVVEVGRQGRPVVFDNEQEIITGPRVLQSSGNTFSVDVKARLGHQGAQARPGQHRPQGVRARAPGGPPARPRVERRRSIHLPRPVPRKRQRSLDFSSPESLDFSSPESLDFSSPESLDFSPSSPESLPFFDSARV